MAVSPTAVAFAPAAAEFTPHSVEFVPGPTLHGAVASAEAGEAKAMAAVLVAASKASLNFGDI
jgi:hypothetical protein